MSRDADLEPNHSGRAGPFQIDGGAVGDELSYWASRSLGYAALCGGLIFGVKLPFIF